MPLGERYRAGGLDRVRRKIALACVVCVVAEEVDGLSAFTVNDPQMLPLLDDAAPGHLRRDDLVENNPFFLHPVFQLHCIVGPWRALFSSCKRVGGMGGAPIIHELRGTGDPGGREGSKWPDT